MFKGKLFTDNDFKYSRFVLDKNIVMLLTDGGNDMSRLITTFNNGAMVISASRNEYSQEENIKRTLALKQDLIDLHLGFRPSAGGFIENANTENEVAVEELSFIVPYNKNQMSEEEFFNIAVQLCDKYGQDSVLIKLPNINDGKPFWVDKDKNNVQNFNRNFRLSTKEDFYTRPLKHHTPGFTYDFEKEEIEDSDFLARYYSRNHLLVDGKSLKRKEYDKEGWYKWNTK